MELDFCPSPQVTLLQEQAASSNDATQQHPLKEEEAAPRSHWLNFIVTFYLTPAKFRKLLGNYRFQQVSRRSKTPLCYIMCGAEVQSAERATLSGAFQSLEGNKLHVT